MNHKDDTLTKQSSKENMIHIQINKELKSLKIRLKDIIHGKDCKDRNYYRIIIAY